MIPIHLSISGFLSYRDPVEIDFTGFDLACIAGPNGAGKSSLLDAITWVLFGQARKRDDSVVNTASSRAAVNLTFAYEKDLYRVMRLKPRDKTMQLEFNILQRSSGDEDQLPADDSQLSSLDSRLLSGVWKPLTEHTLRETEERIQQVLRLDYETFVNASFFLQGKADQFTQQRPADRKRILGSILGLEVWEGYRQKASDRRRGIESEIEGLDGRLSEILAELSEEEERTARLKELEAELARRQQERQDQEKVVANIRQIVATLEEQGRLVEALARQHDSLARQLGESCARLEERSSERDSHTEILGRAEPIETAYAGWQAQVAELERLDGVASRFREQEKRREAPRLEIQDSRARLEQEAGMLRDQDEQVAGQSEQIEALRAQLKVIGQDLAVAEGRLARREALNANLGAIRLRQGELKVENGHLKPEMNELKTRIDQLGVAEGAECPLCGQPLSPDEREVLLGSLSAQGSEMGDRFRANQAALEELDEAIHEMEAQIESLAQAEAELIQHKGAQAKTQSQVELLEKGRLAWQKDGALRLQEIEKILKQEGYAREARSLLAEIDAQLKAIGYDAAAHDVLRQAELEARSSEAEMRLLEKARATLAPLEREIAGLQTHIKAQQGEVERSAEELDRARTDYEARKAMAPDILTAEGMLRDLHEAENRLRLEVGAARQKVLVLADLKTRRVALEAQREEFAAQVRQYKQLERAFSRDGVPALLIEQALPEIESRANELLDRLSEGNMSVRFVTQAAYKDKRREDLRETLDIQISDGVGTRDYEMFSGGEAFRVNFAIRLALSEVLAQRAGARLQTLVIDEGFGSQDAQGRQRLIEAINLVRPDFAKVLVITHIEELKDAFPNRIEVEKTDHGSIVKVI
jgi:exonuclease SbcC